MMDPDSRSRVQFGRGAKLLFVSMAKTYRGIHTRGLRKGRKWRTKKKKKDKKRTMQKSDNRERDKNKSEARVIFGDTSSAATGDKVLGHDTIRQDGHGLTSRKRRPIRTQTLRLGLVVDMALMRMAVPQH